MPEPSLGEILSASHGASELTGTGTPAVVIDSRDMVRNLNESARFNAEMKQRRYSEALGGLKELYQDVGKIQSMETLEEDKPLLNKKMADLFQEIGNDPQAIFSPRGGAKFADINKKLGELQSLATQSKQDNLSHKFHEQYLQSDADLQTPENKNIVEGFPKQPLGSRKFQPLEFTPALDVDKVKKGILGLQVKEGKYSDTEFSDDNKWKITKSGTRFKRDQFLKDWNLGYDANPQAQKSADYTFNKIKNDPTQLGLYVDPDTGEKPKNGRELHAAQGKIAFGQQDDIVAKNEDKYVANPYELMKGRQLNALALEGIKENNREKLAAVKAKLGISDLGFNTDYLVKAYSDILGNKTGDVKRVVTKDGQKLAESEVDVPMNILKAYADNEKSTLREGSSLDPTAESIISGNAPDLHTRTKGGELRIGYFQKYKKGDNIPDGKNIGDPVLDKEGIPIVEKQTVIPRTSLAGVLGKGVIQQKFFSSAIMNLDEKLKGKGEKEIDNIKNDDGEPKKEEPKGKTYNVGGKTYTESQLEKGAKYYKLSLDEYKKQLGIK